MSAWRRRKPIHEKGGAYIIYAAGTQHETHEHARSRRTALDMMSGDPSRHQNSF
jgi:hypothetical protein